MAEHEASPFAGHLMPGARPALVLVDMVRAYFEPGAPFFLDSPDTLASASRVLSAARRSGIPVIHTRVSYTRGGADGGNFVKKVPQLACFAEGEPLGEIMPDVAPLATEPVISKQYASAFFGTSLSSTLAAQGVDTVLIAGVSTSGCVRATAVDALQYGFIPVVVRDAVGDRGSGPHESNLSDIQAKYGEVLTEAEALAYLARREGGESA
jgi:nicotinamidase-related amidase